MLRPIESTLRFNTVVSVQELNLGGATLERYIHTQMRQAVADKLVHTKMTKQMVNMEGVDQSAPPFTHAQFRVELIVLTPLELQQLIEQEARRYGTIRDYEVRPK